MVEVERVVSTKIDEVARLNVVISESVAQITMVENKYRAELAMLYLDLAVAVAESSRFKTKAEVRSPPPDLSILPSNGGSAAIDAVTEAEPKENGFRSTRRTKPMCTISPATFSVEQLEALSVGGMNVARVNNFLNYDFCALLQY
ncbi:hypothetical protein Cni_G02080 [Canna indica]|uniref:Uncharacterized protein n=1 Tax=Canna indica TaxID=4628 RepID=A0AAQ3PZL2_9LILI|nr:hypothetical protein Cni_G02080 [Canna indica]